MREEFHGERNADNVVTASKQLYGWGTIEANIWLPSLCELVGYTGTEQPTAGTYYSAMQGLNTSDRYYTDAQGGNQFAYFKQYNASGGGEKIWNACEQEKTWLRSPHCGWGVSVWSIESTTTFNASGVNVATLSNAVHPAGDKKEAAQRLLVVWIVKC